MARNTPESVAGLLRRWAEWHDQLPGLVRESQASEQRLFRARQELARLGQEVAIELRLSASPDAVYLLTEDGRVFRLATGAEGVWSGDGKVGSPVVRLDEIRPLPVSSLDQTILEKCSRVAYPAAAEAGGEEAGEGVFGLA